MSPFDEVIGGMRVGNSLAQFHLRAPWGVRFATGTEARLVVIARGRCWVRWDGSKTPFLFEAGECLVIKPGVVFALSDARKRAAVTCTSLRPMTPDGFTAEYGGTGEATEILVARFSFDPIAAEPIVAPMPRLVHLPLDPPTSEVLASTLALIGTEMTRGGLGAGFVVNRLTDTLFVQVMRAVFATDRTSAPRWIRALSDRRMAKVIRAVHADLARRWTVAAMAREAGLARSSFAAAFSAAVGASPLDYVTHWRMYRAKVLLSSSDASLAEIASRVGYDSDTALSRAFKREVLVAPGAFRTAQRAALTNSDASATSRQPSEQ